MKFVIVLWLFSVAQCATISSKLGIFLQTTVYSWSRAEIERLVQVSEVLPPNEYHTITVSGFSANVEDGSIRVKSSTGEVEILDVGLTSTSIPRRYLPEYLDLLSALEAEQRTHKKTLHELKLEYSGVDIRLTNVHDYVRLATQPSEHHPRLSVSEVSELLAFEAQEQHACNADKSNLTEKIAAEEKIISEIDKKLHLMKQDYGDHMIDGVFLPAYKSSKELSFRVLSHESRPLDFRISYMANIANWSPEYDIFIDSKSDSTTATDVSGSSSSMASQGWDKLYTMSIDYFANVVQTTGEHWVDTPLVLSTANPTHINQHPEARSEGVQLKESRPPAQQRGEGYQRTAYGAAGNAYGGGQYARQPTCRPSSYPTSQPQSLPTIQEKHYMDGAALPEVTAGFFEAPVLDFEVENYADVNMMQAQSVSTGDLGASHKFRIQYPVSINSTDLVANTLPTGSMVPNKKHLVLVDRVEADAKLFTYAVPSMDCSAHLMGWAQYGDSDSGAVCSTAGNCSSSSSTTTTGESLSPLLRSYNARVQIQGDNVGTVMFNAVQPREMIRLNLGYDQHIHITSHKVMPQFKGKEEDKSTWFTVDKKQFRVKTEERSTTLRSSYGGNETRLVIVSENLPRSLEADEVSVELLSSNLKDAVTPKGADVSTNNGFLEGILKRETVFGSASTGKPTVYYNRQSGHLYWAMWLKAGEAVTLPFKYKITWPAEKDIEMV